MKTNPGKKSCSLKLLYRKSNSFLAKYQFISSKRKIAWNQNSKSKICIIVKKRLKCSPLYCQSHEPRQMKNAFTDFH